MCSAAGLLFLFVYFSDKTVWSFTTNYKIIPTSDYKLCSPIHKNNLKLNSLSHSVIITESRYVNNHNNIWEKNDICTFRVQSLYPKSGIIAVIQRMNLRKDDETNTCIDYIELFGSSQNHFNRDQHCGVIDRYFPKMFNNSGFISFYDPGGEITVEIFVSRVPLGPHEQVEYEIVFTPFVDCSDKFRNQLRACDKFGKVCINESFFGDSALNCPFVECVDESSCIIEHKEDHYNLSTEGKVFIGSISLVFIMFALFILSLWVFKKHKLLCWAPIFSNPSRPRPVRHPSLTSCNQVQVELSDSTGARLAQSPSPSVQTTAPPIDRGKDLPPSYDSLFPDIPPPSIQDLQFAAPSAPPSQC